MESKKEDSETKIDSTFIQPLVVEISSLDTPRPRRSTRYRQDSGQSPNSKQSSKRSNAADTFKAVPNPLQPKFRDPGKAPAPVEYGTFKVVKLAKTELKALGVDISAQTHDIPSSLPSIKSNIPDDISETSSLSTARSSTDLEADRHLLEIHDSPTPASHAEIDHSLRPLTEVCPACKATVSKDLFETFQREHDLTVSGGRIPWKHQKLFCKTHRIHTARDKWKERGYPNINWDILPRRIEQHETLIEGILVGKRPSHYRKGLEEKVQSGKKMTFVRSMASSNETGYSQTGYYGSRGAKMM